VVALGETDWLPAVAVELVQPLGVVAEQELTLVELQVRVELPPVVTELGLALKDTVALLTLMLSPAVELKLGKMFVLVAELAKPLPLVKAMLAVAAAAVVVKCSTATIWSPVKPPTWPRAMLITPLAPTLWACRVKGLVE
jgi:hypothetical protein